MQLGLNIQYPLLGLFEARPRRVRIHSRPPGISVTSLRVCCPPSPCGRLSRPRTTTQAPPLLPPSVDGAPARLPTGRRRQQVPVFTIDRSTASVPRCAPAASQRLRRSRSPLPPDRRGRSDPGVALRCWQRRCAAIRPLSVRFEPADHLRGFTIRVPHVHLSVSLAGPGPSDSADPSRRCQGCSRSCPHLRARAALSFSPSAATDGGWRPFTSTRFNGASRRTTSRLHARHFPSIPRVGAGRSPAHGY